MIFWRKDISNIEIVKKSVVHVYGIPKPENIQGFAGYFGFSFGNIFVSQEINTLLEKDKDFEKTVNDCLDKFKALDYGSITEENKKLNDENRLFFGINYQLLGLYYTKYGRLKINVPSFERTEIFLLKGEENDCFR